MLNIHDIPLLYAISFSLVIIDQAITRIVDLIISKYFSNRRVTNVPINTPVVGQSAAGGTEQTVPYARFKEVNDALKAYKDLGFSAEEVQEALVALAAFVEQAQAADQGRLAD